jgi:hypothetical protein
MFYSAKLSGKWFHPCQSENERHWLLVEGLEASCAGGLRLGRIGQGLKAAAGGSPGYAVHGLLLDEKP